MPLFFQGVPGRTAVLYDPAVQGSVALASVSPRLGYDTHRTIVTRVAHAQRCNYQFLHTLGNHVYIYVFGDRVGSLTLSGISMGADCASGDGTHGAEMVLGWYQLNRVANRQEPVRVVLGSSTAFDGFVTGLAQDVIDPSLRIVSFSLQIDVPPQG